MTRRLPRQSLFAPRLAAFLAVWALALAWSSNARAGCGGTAHLAGGSHSVDILGLSPELTEGPDALSSPLKPAGCTGAFCSKPYQSAGTDFKGGVDLRTELWAHVIAWASPPVVGRQPVPFGSDDLRSILRRDVIFHPPR